MPIIILCHIPHAVNHFYDFVKLFLGYPLYTGVKCLFFNAYTNFNSEFKIISPKGSIFHIVNNLIF